MLLADLQPGKWAPGSQSPLPESRSVPSPHTGLWLLVLWFFLLSGHVWSGLGPPFFVHPGRWLRGCRPKWSEGDEPGTYTLELTWSWTVFFGNLRIEVPYGNVRYQRIRMMKITVCWWKKSELNTLFMDQMMQCVKMSILPKLICRFKRTPIKFSALW